MFKSIFAKKNHITSSTDHSLNIKQKAILLPVFIFYHSVIFILAQKVIIKNFVLTASVFLLSILLTCFLNQLYAYFSTSSTDCYTTVGNQLIVQPLYLADSSAVNYFKDPIQKKYIASVLTQMKKQKLSYSDIPLNPVYPQDLIDFYRFNFNDIGFITCNSIYNIAPEEKNHFMIAISKILLIEDFKRNFTFFMWKFALFFGEVPMFFCFSLLLIIAAYRLTKVLSALSKLLLPQASYSFS